MESKQNKQKNKKGFYAALGISFTMVLCACIYSYAQGNDEDDYNSMEVSSTYEAETFEEIVPDIISTETSEEETETEYQQAAAVENENVPEISEMTEETEERAESAHRISYPLEDEREVIQEFSHGELVRSESEGCWKTHNGTDFKTAKGDKVFASDTGVVSSVKEEGLWGIVVTIDHENGYVTKYTGLGNDICVNEGDKVESGQQIGNVGDVVECENTIESHFHFEVLENNKYIDPLEYLSK